MANAETVAAASGRLLELVGRLERHEGFAEVVESLGQGHAATLDGVWGSSCALAVRPRLSPMRRDARGRLPDRRSGR